MGPNIQSIQIAFLPCQSTLPFLWHRFFQNFTWTIQGQGHSWRPHSRYSRYRLISLSLDVNEPSHSYIQLFRNLTLKIQGHGQGWGGRWKSQHGSNIPSTHIPFVPCLSAIPFLRYDFFQNLTLKIQGQGHGWGQSWRSQSGCNILSTHIPFVPCQSTLPFLIFKIF